MVNLGGDIRKFGLPHVWMDDFGATGGME